MLEELLKAIKKLVKSIDRQSELLEAAIEGGIQIHGSKPGAEEEKQKPTKKPTKPETTAEAEDEDEDDDMLEEGNDVDVSSSDVAKLGKSKMAEGIDRKTIKKLISKHGAEKISELDQDGLNKVHAALLEM